MTLDRRPLRPTFALPLLLSSLLLLACSSGGSGPGGTGAQPAATGGSAGGGGTPPGGGGTPPGSGGAIIGGGGTAPGTGGSGASGGATAGTGGTTGGGTGGGSAGGTGPTTPIEGGWGNVRFDGGGFVAGILASPAEEGLLYARTDVGGVYRWDGESDHWVPLLDWVSQNDVGLLGIESFAVDPQNPERLYVVAGTSYFSGGKTAVLRSEDYGDTFEVIDVSDQWRAHGNGMGRQSGEKLGVDPKNPDVLFCGTRAAGLFKSQDAGLTWAEVSTLGAQTDADLVNENGISFVLFDPASAETADGSTSTIFLGLSSTEEDNLYVSGDGGETFDPIAGGPAGLMPLRAALSGDALYLTFSDGPGPHSITQGAFYRYEVSTETWTNLTPPTDDGMDLLGNGSSDYSHGFGGVSIDPSDPSHLLLTTLNFYGGQSRYADGKEGWGDRIYETTDGGETWTTTFSWADATAPESANVSAEDTAWISGQAIHWTGSITFDPMDPSEAWVVSGNGVFHTETLDAELPLWTFESKGIEETVPLDLVSIPGGPLVTAIGDYDGAVYSDITLSSPLHQPPIGTTYSLGYAPLTGSFLRTGHVTDYSTGTAVESDAMYFSSDAAASWMPLPSPVGPHGMVALSADGQVLLHRPEDSAIVYRSEDMGATWTEVSGLDAQAQYARIVCDPVDANVFYVLDQLGVVKQSVDKGASFAAVGSVQDDAQGLFQSSNGLIRTVPARQGHLWAPLDQQMESAENGSFSENGLAFSEDGGVTWSRIAGVTSAQAVGLGKANEGADYETLFIWGVAGAADNPVGIYYSTDKGDTWARMNDDDHQYGGPGNGAFVQGDMNVFGRVYMSTAGRGLIYGHIGTLGAD